MADERWLARTLVAISSMSKVKGDTGVIQEVAIQFADRFEPQDRAYESQYPRWHRLVRESIDDAIQGGFATRGKALALTDEGEARVPAARKRLAKERKTQPSDSERKSAPEDDAEMPLMVSGCITPALRTTRGRKSAALSTDDDTRMPVMVELNLQHEKGPAGSYRLLTSLWKRVTGGETPHRLADEYATGELTMNEVKRIVAADAAPIAWSVRAIYRIWPDFQVRKHVDESAVTVKADAARRSFDAYGDGIVWAVIDSGIEQSHVHFKGYGTLTDPVVRQLHRHFTSTGPPNRAEALVDEDGHGTHVAGIIAGGLARWDGADSDIVVVENRYNVDNPNEPMRQPRKLEEPRIRLAGMAPRTKLVSLKVLGGGGALESRVSRVIQALAYVRKINASNNKFPRIHGVNLSVGYDFDPTWFACGRSPLCQEVDKLVRTGVVVVVAAGNSGFGRLSPTLSTVAQFGLGMTINDPGNAAHAITVGSTHRNMPHAYGVSYFSSKGPTGDGRRKPDLVAPGERITSAAAGQMAAGVVLSEGQTRDAIYVEESGTSMAAPHVSGAIAAFLSVRREFIGRPDEVKQIFVDSATPLGRDPFFEGGGLVDLMRAMQAV